MPFVAHIASVSTKGRSVAVERQHQLQGFLQPSAETSECIRARLCKTRENSYRRRRPPERTTTILVSSVSGGRMY